MHRIVCGVRWYIVLQRKVIGPLMIRIVFKIGVSVGDISVYIYGLKK